jgi:hypothetical protein
MRTPRTKISLILSLALAAGLALTGAQRLWAQDGGKAPRVFLALASGSQETPSVDTPAVAFGRFIPFPDLKLLFYEVRISGLKGDFTGMHLHRGRAGQAGPVVYPLAAPVNGSSIGIVVNFDPADEAELANQGFYLNVHSQAHPGGECRGQVMPSPGPLSTAVNP